MRILYHGTFLAEGLNRSGHAPVPFPLHAGCSLRDLAARLCPNPDLVLIELWGNQELPVDLHSCPYPLACYAIDSCINEYWLVHSAQLFDHVFVDQLSSVSFLKSLGINAVWLPLCVSEDMFKKPQPPQYDISFVGVLSKFRVKRNNLISYITRHFPLHIEQGISTAQMQDVFSKSKIVLNENFFSGLTLRVLQGLASGSVVLTEAGGLGVSDFFTNRSELFVYSPQDLLAVIKDILNNYPEYKKIADRGQQACRERHTSLARSKECLDAVLAGTALTPRREEDARKLCQARALCALKLRFGGSLRPGMAALKELVNNPGPAGAEAALTLAGLYARFGRTDEALALYAHAVAQGCGPRGRLQKAVLCLGEMRTETAGELLREAIALLPAGSARLMSAVDASLALPDPRSGLLLVAAEIFRGLGLTLFPGFLKQQDDRCPDTAFDAAHAAWELEPSPEALDMMIRCADSRGVSGELLPILRQAILMGAANDRQILYAADLAEKYYDFDLAATIRKAFVKSRRFTGRTEDH